MPTTGYPRPAREDGTPGKLVKRTSQRTRTLPLMTQSRRSDSGHNLILYLLFPRSASLAHFALP